MPLTKDERKLFYEYVKAFFKQTRFGTTEQILVYLQNHHKKLALRIRKESKKIGPIAYIGRYLMRPLTQENWVKHNGKKWVVEPAEGICMYCLATLSEVYVLDANHNQYCDFDCLDEMEAEYLEDGYWDEYSALFEDFKSFYPECSWFLRHMNFNLEPIHHIELCKLIEQLEEWFECSEYNHIFLNGGDDGAAAAEMYRMVTDLESCLEELKKMDEEVRKVRGSQHKLYGLRLAAEKVGGNMKNRTYQSFLKKNKSYFDEATGMWVTDDMNLRSDWYIKLSKVFDGVGYVNLLECPVCKKFKDGKDFKRTSADGYQYCSECYGELF